MNYYFLIFALPLFLIANAQSNFIGNQTSTDSERPAESAGLGNALVLVLGVGVLPLFVGLTIVFTHKMSEPAKGFIASIAFGIAIFSLIDLFEGASGLGIDFGPRSQPLQLALLLSFAIGLVIPFSIGRSVKNEPSTVTPVMAYLFAASVAFHGFAEGIVVGYDLQTGYTFTFAQRSLQAASFFLHKIAEGFVIALPIILMKPKASTVLGAGIIGSVPLLFGVMTAYEGIPGVVSTYGFALGAGVTTFVLFKLAHFSQLLSEKKLIMFCGIMIGLSFMYFAGLIHTIEI